MTKAAKVDEQKLIESKRKFLAPKIVKERRLEWLELRLPFIS